MAGNHLHDLGAIIEDLDRRGRLTRVRSEVDPRHELAGIAAKLEGGPRAVLFEKVKGHRWPVLAGLYWNRGLLGELMRKDERALPQFVSACIAKWQREPVDPVVIKKGPVLDVTEPDVDLGKIPVPVHALKDGGSYFDAAVVIAKDPETGVRNASIQRFQVINRNTLHVNIDAGRHLEVYLEKAKRMGRSLWITLNCGVGPGLHFAASTPAEAAPIDKDELGIASEFHGAPLELVPGTESDVEMVAHAMWALECEMIPGETGPEGPFAEVTNYYASVAPRPVVHVRRIHRRTAPVFHTILAGAEAWNSVGLLAEANVLALLQRQVPGVRDVHFSHGGGGFYHAIVQIEQKRAGWSKQAILAAFAAFPPLKMVTVVDDDVDLRSAQDVEWAMATRLDPAQGIVVINNAFGHGLNPSFPNYVGPKVGFDATQPFPKRAEYERVAFKPVALEAYDIAAVEPALAAKPAVRAAAPVHAAAAPVPAPVAVTAPAPVARPSSDYDTNRIWERELSEWKSGRGVSGERAPSPTATPDERGRAVGSDWDENRWWKREMAEMKREAKAPTTPTPAPKKAAPPVKPSIARSAVETTAPRAGGGDWDENRWWKREMEEMKREREGKKPAAAAPPRRPAPPPRPAIPARSAEPRQLEARANGGASDDEDGGFFRGGAM
jgi:2,5-furandicarboxylate decarboxylase 1